MLAMIKHPKSREGKYYSSRTEATTPPPGPTYYYYQISLWVTNTTMQKNK